jgi:hypothetical protein
VLHVSTLQQLMQQATQQLGGEGQLHMAIAHLLVDDGGSYNSAQLLPRWSYWMFEQLNTAI